MSELVLVTLVAFVALLAALAQKMKVPYPILLVLGGLALSFVPIFPKHLATARTSYFSSSCRRCSSPPSLQTSWREFKYNLVSISMLAFGLVAFTVAGVAIAAHFFLPGFDWRTGAVLGAVVSTTDAIAIGAIAKRIGLPQRPARHHRRREPAERCNRPAGAGVQRGACRLRTRFPRYGHGILQLFMTGGRRPDLCRIARRQDRSRCCKRPHARARRC